MTFSRIITLASLLFITLSTQAEVFRFSGDSDKNYTNPENWSPSYPGIIISADDQVILESEAEFDGPLLLINGGFRIESHASLDAPSTHIQLTPGASIDLRGKLLLMSLITEGNMILQPWSKLRIKEFIGETGSETMIMAMGDAEISGKVEIAGRVDLYGTLTVGGTLTQSGQLVVMASALLEAEAGIFMDSDTSFYYHPEATMLVGTNGE